MFILLIKYFFTGVTTYRFAHLDITLISTIAAESRKSYCSTSNRRKSLLAMSKKRTN
jgi:hypothetical protein